MLWNRRESVTLYAIDLATCYEVLSGNTLSISIGIGTFLPSRRSTGRYLSYLLVPPTYLVDTFQPEFALRVTL